MTVRARFFQVGDLHVGRGRERFGEAASLARSSKLFDVIFQAAKAEKCHAVLITGDVFDTKSVTLKERELLVSKLMKYAGSSGIPTYIISGNHDLTKHGESNLDFLAPITEAGEIPNLHVARAARWEVWNSPFSGLQIIGAGVDFSEKEKATFDIVEAIPKDQQYIFMGHGMIKGSTRNDKEWKPGEAEDRGMSLARAGQNTHVIWWAYGDVHKRQKLPTLPAHCNGWYAGSPIQMDFGEAPNRGGLVVAFDQAPEGWKFVGKRFVRLDAEFNPLVTVTTEAELEAAPKEAWLRLDPELRLSQERHEKVLTTYKVVDDRSTPESTALIIREAQDQNQPASITGFDPLMSNLADIEAEVLRDLDEVTKTAARPLVGLAIEKYRNRSYLS